MSLACHSDIVKCGVIALQSLQSVNMQLFNMSIPALRFHKVVKRYRSAPVLQELELEVRAGEFFALTGVNGAGKTSLIKCLFDFIALDAGSIEIHGLQHRLPAARAPLAFLPERFMPPYYLSGQDFLNYMLKLHGVAPAPNSVAAQLAALEFDGAALGAPVRTLSKGMTQKLGLAACLLSRKNTLVLDEPMSGLDPKARALFKTELGRVRERAGTLFFSTHALADVEEICDRMAILHQGRLRFVGTPAECRTSYGAHNLEQAFINCIG